MSWPSAQMLLDLSHTMAGAAVNWWIQSGLLIAVGLMVGVLCRRRGSAVQSAVYRTTLAAVIAAPLVTWGLQRADISGWSVEMPAAWSFVEAARLADVSGADDQTAADRQAVSGNELTPIESAADGVSAAIASYPIDGDLPVDRSISMMADAPPELPPPASPSLLVPSPSTSSQVANEVSRVFTLHRFGIVAAAASAAWLLIGTVHVVRLAMAWRRLGRIRRRAAPADSTVQATCGELAMRLRVAPPDVLRSPYLPSPCLAGLRRPVVLLPEAAGDLPVRDVLAHELAHLSRGDCHWNLARQLIGSLLFYQPLLGRLSRRLEATAEEVCDDIVVHLGGDRRSYALRLVDIAELSLAPVTPAGVGMVSLRSMLGQRVTRILDTSRSLSTRVGGAMLALVLVGGMLGTFAAGLVGLSARASAIARDNEAVATEATHAPGEEQAEQVVAATDGDLVTVRGQVVDPDGKPVPDADVYALRWYWDFGDRKPLASTRSDDDGRFEISYRKSQFADNAGRPNQWRETFIASFLEGYGPGWTTYQRLKPGESAVVKLAVDDVPIEGRVVDLEGNPVAGASLVVGTIAQPKGESLDEYMAAIKSGQAMSAAYATIDESLPQHLADHWPTIVTDKDGRFRASGFGRERLIELHLAGPTIVSDSLRVATRRMQPIVHPAYAYKSADNTVQYGAELQYTAAPSRPIEGVVRDAETREPIVGAEIWSWKFAGQNISGISTTRTKSGADGSFRLQGMPKGEGNIIIVVPTDLPYFTAEFDVPNPSGSDPVPLDIELHRGVWVTGRVTDKVTGAPVSARIHYITFPDNQNAQGLKEFDHGRHVMSVQHRFRTDVDGRYRVVALPGRGIIGAHAVLQPYPGGQGYNDIAGVEDRESFRRFNGVFAPTEKFPTAVKQINVDADAAETVCDFELDPGGRVTIRAIDAEGAPLSGVRVTGVSEIDGFMEPMESAEFELVCFRPGENRTVLLYEPERRLGKSLRIKQDDARDGLLEVTLEPVGVVHGRLVNDGQPVSGASLRIDVAGDNDYGRRLHGMATDAEGQFRHDEILPGLKYSILAEGAGIEIATVAKELQVAAGETVDLGTIDLAGDERPEPMRSVGGAAATQAATTPDRRNQAQNDGETLEFAGRVVTPDGKPAAEAELYLVFHIPQPIGLLTPLWTSIGRTDVNGSFELSVNPRDFGAGLRRTEVIASSLVAAKDGFGFAFAPSGLYEKSGSWRETVERRIANGPAELAGTLQRLLTGAGEPLRLSVDDESLRGRVINVDGEPLRGVRFTLLEIWAGENDDLTPWRNAAKQEKADYYSARMTTTRTMNGPQLRSIVRPAVSDANGRFTLRGIGRGRIAELLVEGPGVASERIFARTEAGEPVVLRRERRFPDLGEYTFNAAEFTYVAGPSVPIEGVVRDAATKRPLAGVTVKSQARHGEEINGWGQDFVRAVTDEKGRYRLTGMPVGDGNRIAAIAPDDKPYLSISARAPTRNDQASLEVNFDLPTGVWIEGRITDKQTGRGLAGQLAYFVVRDNPHYALARSFNVDERDRLQADDDGRFRIAALPGPGYISVSAFDHQNYPRASFIIGLDGTPTTPSDLMLQTVPSYLMLKNHHAVAEVNPAAEDEGYELSLQLDGGKIVGRVVDDEGKPVSGFMYSGQIAAFGSWQTGRGNTFELLGYNAAAPRRVLFAHGERDLAGSLTVSGETPENLIARLQAAGKVTGRLVDADGAPMPDMTILSWSPLISSPAELASAERIASPPLPPNVAHLQTGQYETNAEGRFEISRLAPGVEYRLRAVALERRLLASRQAPRTSGTIDAVIVVEPGQTLDLGDVVLKHPE